jgi:hypothetical protein
VSGFLVREGTVPVELGECLCPGTPHPNGDVVELRKEISLEGGLAVIAEFTSDTKTSIVERLGRVYLRVGIASWTFVDEDGAPIPASPENIARLRWTAGIYVLADRAADLYGEEILAPLARRESGSSPSGPSDDSTSPIPLSSEARRKR